MHMLMKAMIEKQNSLQQHFFKFTKIPRRENKRGLFEFEIIDKMRVRKKRMK